MTEEVREWVFASGKYKGKSTPQLMFENYPYLMFIKKKMEKDPDRKKNRLEKSIDYLFSRGESLKAKKDCPHCKKKKVRYFSVRYSYSGTSIAPYYTACSECVDSLRGDGMIEIYPLKFSSIARMSKSDLEKVNDVFRWAFDLEGRLTKKKALDTFEE